MKIITWNVNSIRARFEAKLAWLMAQDADVLLLQETRVDDAQFPFDAFGDYGYDVVHVGTSSRNGVATLVKSDGEHFLLDVERDTQQARWLACTYRGVRLVNVYAPARSHDGKVEWLTELRNRLEVDLTKRPQLIAAGDWNVTLDPLLDAQVDQYDGTLPEERYALTIPGLTDAYRKLHPTRAEYTWTRYPSAFRLDYHLVSDELAPKVTECEILQDCLLSDHRPVRLTVPV